MSSFHYDGKRFQHKEIKNCCKEGKALEDKSQIYINRLFLLFVS